MHKEAKKYDVGIYFEQNGHGTVLVNFNNLELLKKNYKEQAHLNALNKLEAYLKMANRTVGDSIANILLVEAALYMLDSRIDQLTELYQEHPCVLESIHVNDRSKFISNKTEEKLVKPEELQAFIDSTIKQGERAFVRASGTEQIARIYSEAYTVERAKEIANSIKDRVGQLHL